MGINTARHRTIRELKKRLKFGAQVSIVQKGILRVPNIYKSGIKARHKAFDTPYENVPYGKIVVGLLVVDFYQLPVLEQRNLNLRGGGINNEFFFHGILFGPPPATRLPDANGKATAKYGQESKITSVSAAKRDTNSSGKEPLNKSP